MIAKEEAKAIADKWVQEHSPRGEGDIVVYDDLTIEKPYGWVFFYDLKARLDGKPVPISNMLAGNAPLLVTKSDGKVHVTGTAKSVDYYLQSFETWLNGGEDNYGWGAKSKSQD